MTTRPSTRSPDRLLVAVLVAGLVLPAAVEGQTVTGVVLDAGSREALATVELLLRSEDGAVVARDESAADGTFLLSVRNAGDHTLEASRLGYAAPPPLEIALGVEVVEVEVLLVRSPLELEPVSVVTRRRDPRHDATLQGALVRHNRFPRVGGRRVVLREDPEMASAVRIRDVLRWFPPTRRCIILYWDGRLQQHPVFVDEWLDSSTGHFEAVEFYRWFHDAPQAFQGIPSYVNDPAYVIDPGQCSVVALWSRPPDERSRTGIRRRSALAAGAAAGLWALGWLLIGR
jgi:hypothetical protein